MVAGLAYLLLYFADGKNGMTEEEKKETYGHNMKDGSMFGELDEYKEQSFFQDHPLIYFDTLYEERTCEIMAVFLSQVYENEENAFKYYEFYQADTEEEFFLFTNP